MSLSSVFNIAGSGMSAQTTRLNTVASEHRQRRNRVVEHRPDLPRPSPGVRHHVPGWPDSGSDSLFQSQDAAGQGVQVLGVVEDQSNLEARYEPNHPAADAKGYVYYPNVNVVEEMADMISASRSFQTNAEMMNTAKTMMQKVLTLGQ